MRGGFPVVSKGFRRRSRLLLVFSVARGGLVAQLVEHRTENPGVGGSIPSQPTIQFKQLPIREFPLPGEPPVTVMTSAGGVLEELRELSQRLARRFSWNPLQAVLFILTGAIPSVPLVRVTSERSASRPAFTRVVLDVDPTASPSLVAEQYRQHRKDIFPRRVRALSARHLKLAAFVARRAGAATWPELFEEWNRKHAKWKYQRRNIFKRDCVRARMRVLTLGMAGSGRSYSEDEGKLVSRVRLARKASAKASPTARSRKQSTRGGGRPLKRE